MISASPVPSVSGALICANPARSDSGTSIVGQTCRNTRLLSSRCLPAALRLHPPDALQAGGQHPLGRRERDDVAVGVPQRRDVTNLGQGDQPFVGRVVRARPGGTGRCPPAAGIRVPVKFFNRHRSSR